MKRFLEYLAEIRSKRNIISEATYSAAPQNNQMTLSQLSQFFGHVTDQSHTYVKIAQFDDNNAHGVQIFNPYFSGNDVLYFDNGIARLKIGSSQRDAQLTVQALVNDIHAVQAQGNADVQMKMFRDNDLQNFSAFYDNETNIVFFFNLDDGDTCDQQYIEQYVDSLKIAIRGADPNNGQNQRVSGSMEDVEEAFDHYSGNTTLLAVLYPLIGYQKKQSLTQQVRNQIENINLDDIYPADVTNAIAHPPQAAQQQAQPQNQQADQQTQQNQQNQDQQAQPQNQQADHQTQQNQDQQTQPQQNQAQQAAQQNQIPNGYEAIASGVNTKEVEANQTLQQALDQNHPLILSMPSYDQFKQDIRSFSNNVVDILKSSNPINFKQMKTQLPQLPQGQADKKFAFTKRLRFMKVEMKQDGSYVISIAMFKNSHSTIQRMPTTADVIRSMFADEREVWGKKLEKCWLDCLSKYKIQILWDPDNSCANMKQDRNFQGANAQGNQQTNQQQGQNQPQQNGQQQNQPTQRRPRQPAQPPVDYTQLKQNISQTFRQNDASDVDFDLITTRAGRIRGIPKDDNKYFVLKFPGVDPEVLIGDQAKSFLNSLGLWTGIIEPAFSQAAQQIDGLKLCLTMNNKYYQA